ncbi:profilin-1-like [Centroberyx gerrardi]
MADKQEEKDTPWYAYLDILANFEPEAGNLLMESAIVGLDGRMWAGRGMLGKITADEVKTLTGSDRASLFMNGPKVGGVKCTMVRDWFIQDGTMHLKTLKTPLDNESYCIFIAKTKTALIFAKGNPTVHGGNLEKRVMFVGDYLKNLNM